MLCYVVSDGHRHLSLMAATRVAALLTGAELLNVPLPTLTATLQADWQ